MITVYEPIRGEYVEKKSRFIASLAYVTDEAEADAFIAKIKKEFYDARHNCSAYIIRKPDGQIVKKSSDDGEPQGTAGHPMLDVLEKEDVGNVVCVVTRYFGGTLLGTGGLVRAYTKAVQAGLENSTLVERKNGFETKVSMDYTLVGKMEYYVATNDIAVREKNYMENVEFVMVIPEEDFEKVEKDISALTNAKAEVVKGDMLEYAKLDGQALVGGELVKKEEEKPYWM